jgi:hypothetical protein
MARIKRAPPYVRSTPPRAAKKSSTVSSSGHKKPHSEEDEEDDGVDASGEEYSKHSGEESGGSEEEEATEEEDADDSESEAEESESNAKEVVQQEARARATDDTSSDESNPNGLDRYADLDDEDKKDIRSLQFTEDEILKYEEQLKMSRDDYSSFMRVLAIPKLFKHLTAQHTLGSIQYISYQLDPKNNRVPDIEEIRSFLYLQELVLLFAKKERKGKANHSDSEEDEDSDESTKKESEKKAKSNKKNTQVAQCKYYCTRTSSFSVYLFVAIPFILISLSLFFVMFSISWLR